MMKELFETIAKQLVDHPDDVIVTQDQSAGMVTLQLKVHPDDMGKVIGRQGRIARAIRTVIKAAANKENTKVSVEISQ